MDSDSAPQFAPFFGKAWTILAILVGLLLLAMFYFGPVFMHVGEVIWTLLRWLASPFI